MGAALLVVVASGDSLFYVRETMDLPLVLAGVAMVLLGLAATCGVGAPAHAPRSLALVLAPVVLLLVARPGPLSVDTGLARDWSSGAWVETGVEVPESAIVGEHASPGRVDAQAFELDPGQFSFAVAQLPDQFKSAAVRMVGQIDVDDDDGTVTLVRFMIRCCAADALRLSVELEGADGFKRGTWVTVAGQWNGDTENPALAVATITAIDQPDNPYLTVWGR